ncbi:MAG: DASH family cryptochrome, partial [Psychroserpens sp.]|nr:DASH family cryptochrome [Psychroserpens sp.]
MQETQNNIGLVWFRNDLRVQDNTVLNTAIRNHKSVIAFYCFDPEHFHTTSYGFRKTEKFRAKFLIETITNLKANLNALHIELFISTETPESGIKRLVEQFKIQSIYLQKEWTSEEVSVLNKVKKSLGAEVNVHDYFDQFLYHPEDINIPFEEIPQVFTNFRKKVEKYSKVRPSVTIHSAEKLINIVNETKIPSLNDLGFEDFETHPHSAFPFKGGETNAFKRLNEYIFETKKLAVYKKTRNGLIGTDFSSKFSPWLANGSLSARTIYWYIKEFENKHFKNESTYWLIFELIWRDYFKYIALKHQNNIFKIGGILNKNYDWKTDEHQIKKWIDGQTRSSFVNANMIELKKTGWMSNRGR